MNVAAYLVVGPGEGDRYLEEVLKQLWAEDICVCLNNADEKTKNLVNKYATLVKEDNREWGKEQWRIKQDFLAEVVELCTVLKQDLWIWCLDADEIFDPSFTRNKAEELASGKDIAWYFWCLQLWNSNKQVRLDLSFPNIRFYKVVKDLGLDFQTTALHCGLAPRYAYQWGSQSNLYFKHYGLMTFNDRQRKIARYEKYDPNAKFKGKDWYNGLKNEKAHLITLEEAIAQLPEIIRRKKDVKKYMAKDREIFMFRNKHGKVVPAVGSKQREQFLKSGFAELSNITVNPHPEAPVVTTVEDTEQPIETEYTTEKIPETQYQFEENKTGQKKDATGKKNKKKVS